MEAIFKGLFDTEAVPLISLTDFLLCLGISLILGFVMAKVYTLGNICSKSFVITLALLPAVVCVVIMMVNGNIGTGVAVAGAFSLVRFRSAPGSAKEIVSIFLAMGTGLIAGMGYLAFASLFALIMCAVLILCNRFHTDTGSRESPYKTIKVTIPEDLDYSCAFHDLFKEYTREWELVRVKTTNMGSMFRLTYDITLRDSSREKELIDCLRTRNGNLEILVSKRETHSGEL